MSSKSALKKKSRASLGDEVTKRKSDGVEPAIENLENVQIVKQKKKKGESVSETPLSEVADNVAKNQDKKVRPHAL